MRRAALGVVLLAAMSSGCGYATAPPTATAFALDAGNYTLKVSCTGGFVTSGPQEGLAMVTVTRSGTTWAVRSLQTTDTFSMSFTTDGAAMGSTHGEIAGTISGTDGTITANGTITGNNSSANVAGGPITGQSGTVSIVIAFSQPSGGGGCTAGIWTLTPR